jgi:hypothetical protein
MCLFVYTWFLLLMIGGYIEVHESSTDADRNTTMTDRRLQKYLLVGIRFGAKNIQIACDN